MTVVTTIGPGSFPVQVGQLTLTTVTPDRRIGASGPR